MGVEGGSEVERAMQSFAEAGFGSAELHDIAQMLPREIPAGQAREFLTGLVCLTMEGDGGWFTRQQIGGAMGRDAERSASNKWVKNGELLTVFERHRVRLSQGLGGRLLGLEVGGQRPHRYRLAVVDGTEGEVPYRLQGSVLRYRASEEKPQLSWYGRLNHPGVGEDRAAYRKWVFLLPLVMWAFLALLAALAWTSVWALTWVGVPFSPLNYLMYGIFFAIVLCRMYWRWGKLFDDRVILLGMNDISGTEDGVVIDRQRSDGVTYYVLRRYVASCPICVTATVRLAKGRPQHWGRIVGRCEDSPREHVFSFDRVTLEGGPLVQRPVKTASGTRQPEMEDGDEARDGG